MALILLALFGLLLCCVNHPLTRIAGTSLVIAALYAEYKRRGQIVT